MNRDQIRAALLQALSDIAPEVDTAALMGAKPLRRQVDLDSADWMNFLVAVDQSIGVDITDAEAARLDTLDKLVEHCALKLGT
jgi:acyl carrier protein